MDTPRPSPRTNRTRRATQPAAPGRAGALTPHANEDEAQKGAQAGIPPRGAAHGARRNPVAAPARAGGADGSRGLASEPKPEAGPRCACTAMERRCASSKSSARRSGLGRSPHVMASSRSCVQPVVLKNATFREMMPIGREARLMRGRGVIIYEDIQHIIIITWSGTAVRDPPSNAPSGQGVSPGPRSPSPRRGRSAAGNPPAASSCERDAACLISTG